MPVASKNRIGQHGIVVKGTGNAVRDQALLDAANVKFTAWGGGTLWIDGQVQVASPVDFTVPVSIRGISPDAELLSYDDYPFKWNGSWYYTNDAEYSFTMGHAFSESFTPSGVTPAAGDWVLMWSQDAISDAIPHSGTGYVQYPMELHQVHHNIGGKCYVESFIVDNMTSSPQCKVLSMLEGIVIADLKCTIDSSVSPANYAEFFTMRKCANVTIRDCVFDRSSVGAVRLDACANVKIEGISIEGGMMSSGIYGILVTVVNNVAIRDCRFIGTRHVFTTGGIGTLGGMRLGTPLNVSLKNCVVDCPPAGTDAGITGSTVIIDTHPEGWGIVFEGNEINIAGGDGTYAGYGISCRSRNSLIKGNTFRGYGYSGTIAGGTGVYLYGPNTKVLNNRFEHLTYGVRTTQYSDYLAYCDGTEISGNTFKDVDRCPIALLAGDNHRVHDNTFESCARYAGSNPQYSKAHIQLGSSRQQAVTMAGGGSATIAAAANNLANNFRVFFTGGGLPGELTAETVYYIVNRATNTFEVSATRGGAAITFAGGGGNGTLSYASPAGTGIVVTRNTSVKDSNDYFIETNEADENDIEVYGNTTIGYAGAAFSDRYSHRAALDGAYNGLNVGM